MPLEIRDFKIEDGRKNMADAVIVKINISDVFETISEYINQKEAIAIISHLQEQFNLYHPFVLLNYKP